MRIPPGQDADAALKALADHLRNHVPWGAEVSITPRGSGKPYKLEGQGAAYDAMRRAMKEAFDRDPVFMGAGGTIPFVADFAKAFPKATLLLTGAGDPFSNAHSEDESVDLKDRERFRVRRNARAGATGNRRRCPTRRSARGPRPPRAAPRREHCAAASQGGRASGRGAPAGTGRRRSRCRERASGRGRRPWRC